MHAHLVQSVRQTLLTRFPRGMSDAPGRVAGYVEDGLALLLSFSAEPELGMQQIEACRGLAQKDPRFHFIYRLPHSAGFGAAIGDTLAQAFFNESRPAVRGVTALLNIFMTVLDGLLDEVPELVGPHWNELVNLVSQGASGSRATSSPVPGDHPLNRLCFSIAKLWIRMLSEMARPAQMNPLQAEFATACHEAMRAEHDASQARFAPGSVPLTEPLHGRTRWPHWCQALATVLPYEWPASLQQDRFRDLIFRIGDYAAYLDDVCDYLIDCRAARWNTLSAGSHRWKPFEFATTSEAQTRVLIRLADNGFTEQVVGSGIEIRATIENAITRFGAPHGGFQALLADLTYVYLG